METNKIKNFSDFITEKKDTKECKKGYWCDLDFETKEEYFEYFLETYINGNFKQLEDMYKLLKKEGDFKKCLDYLKDTGGKEFDKMKDYILENF